jgi:hypothetical protein
MADFFSGLQAVLAAAKSDGKRSTALGVFYVPIIALLGAVVWAAKVSAPTWMIIGLVALTALVVITFCFAYLYLMVKDRDALRSETYSLEKLHIQHALLGDNTKGLVETVIRSPVPRSRRSKKADELPPHAQRIESDVVEGSEAKDER